MTMPQIALSSITFAAAIVAASHAVIYKGEPRSAAIWVIVVFLFPLGGPVLYLIIGINRVERRAARLREDMVRHRTEPDVAPCDLARHDDFTCSSPLRCVASARWSANIPLAPSSKHFCAGSLCQQCYCAGTSSLPIKTELRASSVCFGGKGRSPLD